MTESEQAVLNELKWLALTRNATFTRSTNPNDISTDAVKMLLPVEWAIVQAASAAIHSVWSLYIDEDVQKRFALKLHFGGWRLARGHIHVDELTGEIGVPHGLPQLVLWLTEQLELTIMPNWSRSVHITGTPTVGSTVTVSDDGGPFAPRVQFTQTYQWFNYGDGDEDFVPIEGETGTSYVLRSDDIGKDVICIPTLTPPGNTVYGSGQRIGPVTAP